MANIKEEKVNRKKGAKVIFIIAFIVFAFYSLTIVFSMLWVFIQSLKTNLEFWDDMISLPQKWLFSNYTEAFRRLEHNDIRLFGMFFNSFWYALGGAVISVFMHAVTGFIFAKYKFRGREAAFSFILFTITIPIVGSLPSLYKVIYTMKINDSPLFLITALGGFTGNFLIMYAFFKGMDWTYAEAAQIDGAGHYFIFFKIMLPLAAGPMFALGILTFIGNWNNYETPILFLDKMPTLSSGLYRFSLIAVYRSAQTVYFAGLLLSILPVLVLVILFGDKISKNLAIGGIKG